MAFSDELVMNVVLAVGGSTRDIGRDVGRAEENEILQYYGQAITELNLGLTRWATGMQGEWEVIRLFLAVLLLCHYVVSITGWRGITRQITPFLLTSPLKY